MPTIVPVVEGDGDAAAFPGLLARILLKNHNRPDVLVAEGKSGVVKANGRPSLVNKLDKFLQHAQNKPDCDAILVLLDADNDCPVILSQELSQRCEQVGAKCPVRIVCARRSYESWFLASLDTIKGKSIIPDTAALSGDAEDISNPSIGLLPCCLRARLTKRQPIKQPLAASLIWTWPTRIPAPSAGYATRWNNYWTPSTPRRPNRPGRR